MGASVLMNIEQAAHLIGVYVERSAGELGITQGEAHVLAQLQRHGPTSVGTLHLEFGHKRSTLTNILDRLEHRGLLGRELNRSDRRSFIITLTPSGKKAARQVTKALDQLERAVLQLVSARDVEGVEAVRTALRSAS